jgi:hypothetical protein
VTQQPPVSRALWDPAQTAEYLRTTEKTLAQWRWLRKGPPWAKVCGLVRYRPAAVDAWLDAQSQGGGTAA